MNRSAHHIVHFSSVHKLDDVRIFWKECISARAAGYRVTFIGRGESTDTTSGVRRLPVKWTPFGGRLGRMILGTANVTRLAIRQKADIYHFHGPELIPFGLFLKLLGKKVIYDAHENFRDQILQKSYLPKPVRRFVAKAVGLLEDLAIHCFDGVVAATPRIQHQLRTAQTISVTNYPIVSPASQPKAEIPRVPGQVIYVGGISVIRGVREMVQAIHLVNQCVESRLIICGQIPPALQNELERMEGWKYVDAPGWIDRQEVLEYLLRSQIGVCVLHPAPNHVESVPNKLFEYMEAGLPVVGSDFPYWQQFVTDVGSGLTVDPLDPHAIAAAILKILSDPDEARKMGEAGTAAVRERFNWELEAEKLIAMYDKLLD